MDVLKIIKDAVARGPKWQSLNQPPMQEGCTCGYHPLFPHRVWEWLQDEGTWRYVRAWVLSNNLSDEAIAYIRKNRPDFWKYHEEYDQ